MNGVTTPHAGRKSFVSRLPRILFALVVVLGLVQVAPAQAAVPNRWGYAYVNVSSGVPVLSHQAGSWSGAFNVTVTPGVPGETIVRFPQIGGPRGVVHVTAVATTPHICQAWKWTPVLPDEIVTVRCHQFGGAPAFVPFTVSYSESSGAMAAPATARFGYVHYNAGIASQYNSSGGINTVTILGIGWYKVVLPGLGSPGQAGNLQVTAQNDTALARCKVSGWSPVPAAQQVEVRCFNSANVPQHSGFSLTYHKERNLVGRGLPPANFAYTFDGTPANPGPYSPLPVDVNYNSQGMLNTIRTTGLGLRLVTFPRVGFAIDHVQVTAFGPGPEHCNLQSIWATSGGTAFVRNVACYSGAAPVANQASFTTYTSTQ